MGKSQHHLSSRADQADRKDPPGMIVIAADHGGYALKEIVKQELCILGYDPLDLGTDGENPGVDYPDYAHAVAAEIVAGRAALGVLICGSGIGMSMVANRHEGVRAALCHDPLSARLAREHNDANILVMGGRLTGSQMACACLQAFLAARFQKGRHLRRVAKFHPSSPVRSPASQKAPR